MERFGRKAVRAHVRPPNTREKGIERRAAAVHLTNAPVLASRLRAAEASVPPALRRHQVFEFDTKEFPFRECAQRIVLGSSNEEESDEGFLARMAELEVGGHTASTLLGYTAMHMVLAVKVPLFFFFLP